ncbi:MAG: endonuclease V, partial [Candidatus Korarchaeota archaeon]|nr:endonuclease V [Candidatus Korarchaeota archaeon]
SDGKPLPGALKRIKEEGGLENLRKRKFFHDIRAWPVFRLMAEAQLMLSSRLDLRSLEGVEVAAGVDVSYGGVEAVAACVSIDSKLEIVEVSYERFVPQIPYVPTYLAFRELRGMLPSVLRCDFDVIFVDGHGLSHPRMLGEASHLGLLLGKPSIGVAKSKLVGRLKGDRVLLRGREVGAIVRSGFVSPGHLVDLESSIEISREFWREGKQPLPLILAHRLSKEAIRGS